MANPKVFDMQSVVPHRMKVASMTQEAVRMLCNSSRDLNTEGKCDILTKFMRKLQISGYGQRLRANNTVRK